LLLGFQILDDPAYLLAEEEWVLLLVVVEDAEQPAHVVLLHGLVQYFLDVAGHSQRVFEARLLAVLAHLIAEDLLVEFDGPGNRVVVPEVAGGLGLQLRLLVRPQHLNSYDDNIY